MVEPSKSEGLKEEKDWSLMCNVVYLLYIVCWTIKRSKMNLTCKEHVLKQPNRKIRCFSWQKRAKVHLCKTPKPNLTEVPSTMEKATYRNASTWHRSSISEGSSVDLRRSRNRLLTGSTEVPSNRIILSSEIFNSQGSSRCPRKFRQVLEWNHRKSNVTEVPSLPPFLLQRLLSGLFYK